MRLYVLPMGLYLPPGSPVPAYLIQTDDGKNILVDSGLPRETIGVYKQPGYEASRWTKKTSSSIALR